MAVFTGAGVAIATPFDENYNIDYESFGRFIDYQIEHKTDAIIVCGTTGESSTLNHEEHIAAIRYCVNRVNKRVPVIAGTGSNCSRTASYLTKRAEMAGVDAALVVTPYYNKATQKGLIDHYTYIARHTDLPLILYNVPSRTGCKLESATIAKLVKDVDNIVGVKEATGDIAFATQIMYDTQGDIDLYSGNDDMIVPMMSIGAKGVISVLSNVAPEDTHNICAEYMAGNVEKSRELQIKYFELIKALFCEVNPIPVKKALELLGFCGGHVRRPLSELEPEHTKRLKKALIETGILAE
ncbi:MAG: 4-hydroxy-tetrahydrodipicolinate synthase [Eubacterium sp.]|nr:4-hydroxy-tetrahydrodipicolinate synthase [Eubacterium sp.]MDD7209676.1 4-hydroxy-tetrahydrodipicolinate synthase [Lachnospiraceae bacterium]MDY5496486.1 4-hydroxy-tetrahydrodipicolinate synthase [Anaerobutyricum sp.]